MPGVVVGGVAKIEKRSWVEVVVEVNSTLWRLPHRSSNLRLLR